MPLSCLMTAMTSCTVFLIRASGAITSAYTTPSAQYSDAPRIIFCNAVMSFPFLPRYDFTRLRLFGFDGFFSLVIDEFADQIFQYRRRLGLLDDLAILEHLAVTAGHQADVLLAQQTRSQDIGERILGKLITLVQTHPHIGFVAFRIQRNVRHAPHQHPGALD